MSQENVDFARKGFEAFNAFMRGDLPNEAYADLLDPHIEYHWHDKRTYPDTPQHLRGRQEAMGFAEKYRDTWDDLTQEPLEIIEGVDDRVLSFVRQTGRGRESGVPITIHFFQIFAFRDGKLSTVDFFRHRADALEAAGLSD